MSVKWFVNLERNLTNKITPDVICKSTVRVELPDELQEALNTPSAEDCFPEIIQWTLESFYGWCPTDLAFEQVANNE
jgi:hypothetical protein